MEQNKSIENLSEAASLAEQMYIETQQVKKSQKNSSRVAKLNRGVILPQHKTRLHVGVCNVTCYFATRPAIRERNLNQFCHFFCNKKNSLSRKELVQN